MISSRWKYFDFFHPTWDVLGLKVDCVFVPPAMIPDDEDNQSVFSNEDLETFKAASENGLVCWVHGSSSVCVKSALRERTLSRCYVSDVIRSDSGIVANPRLALSAPIGSLCSDFFLPLCS